MRRNILEIVLFLTLFFVGCQREKQREIKTIDINLAKPNSAEETVNNHPDSLKRLKIAISAMTSPKETFAYYKYLIKYISEKIGTRIEFTQRKTYNEVNLLLENGQVDFAFICSGAYVDPAVRNKVDILVVPVINGKSLYQAYIITPKGSGITKIEDLKGKSFAFTDPLSHTGYLYALKRLYDLGETVKHFFSKTIFTYAHDNSIQLVEKGSVDGATVDGLIYEYLKKANPERVKNIRIIEKSEYFGAPPVVIQKNWDPILKEKIQKVFLDMHNDSTGREILNKLSIEKYVYGNKKDYLTVRKYRDKIQK